jgi:4-amino-4-deoxy-L-arabinose transferase-like glycosyltransferase
LWILLIAGAVLRAGVIELRPKAALESAPEESENLDIARSLDLHQGFSLNGQPTADRSLLFPALAAAVMLPFHGSPKPVLYVQLLLSCASAWLLYRTGLKRFGSSAALLLCAAWLFYPGAILATALFQTTTLFVFLWIVALALYDRLEDNGFRLRDAVLLGLCAGLTILTRSIGLVLLLSLVLYVSGLRFGAFREVHWRSGLVILFTALVLIVPWMLRNSRAVGHFALTTNSGISLLAGEMTHESAFPSHEARDSIAARRPSLEENTPAPRPQLAAGEVWVRKLMRLWATDIGLWLNYFAQPNDPGLSRSVLWHILPVAVASIPGMLAVGLGAAGFLLVQTFRSRRLYLLQLLLGVAALFLTYGLPRDHFMFLPALLIGAAALWRPAVWVEAPWIRRAAVICTLGAFGGLWLLEGLSVAAM